jgi:protein subunit release factor A
MGVKCLDCIESYGALLKTLATAFKELETRELGNIAMLELRLKDAVSYAKDLKESSCIPDTPVIDDIINHIEESKKLAKELHDQITLVKPATPEEIDETFEKTWKEIEASITEASLNLPERISKVCQKEK